MRRNHLEIRPYREGSTGLDTACQTYRSLAAGRRELACRFPIPRLRRLSLQDDLGNKQRDNGRTVQKSQGRTKNRVRCIFRSCISTCLWFAESPGAIASCWGQSFFNTIRFCPIACLQCLEVSNVSRSEAFGDSALLKPEYSRTRLSLVQCDFDPVFSKKSESIREDQPVSEVTRIIEQVEAGDLAGSEELLPHVYKELRQLAGQRLAKNPDQSLQTTELVHEAYLRLVGADRKWQGRAHFFAAAAEAMRRVLVDRARRRKRTKHGGDRQRVDLHDSAVSIGCPPEEILIVNELFDHLTEKHPAEAEVAKLRYFAGFNHREAAEALEIPISTAHSHWTFAKAWLFREYRKGE